MPAKDMYHDQTLNAIIKDGWKVTHDPLHLSWGGKDLYVDLGAERIIAAEVDNRKIAIEVKSFLGLSEINDIEKALGQYLLYRSVLRRIEPDRTIYLGTHAEIYYDIFEEPLGQLLIEDFDLKLVIIDIEEEVVVKWIQ